MRVRPRSVKERGSPASTSALRRRAAVVLPWVDAALRATYNTAPLGNKRNALDELIYIQLSIRTREDAYQSTYPALRRLARASWGNLLDIPEATLVRRIQA